MNYLIFDTEQTYNYGFIIVNEKAESLFRCNLVLTNNFENRHLIGENTYKRKKPIYEKDPDAKFMGSGEGAEFLKKTLQKYNVSQIISHNISEDRRQLELLAQQTGVKFPEIPFYDSIDLVKVLFPNNTQTALEAIVSDISGIDVKQTHTALQDCDLLYSLIAPIIEYMPCFIEYKDIFAHDNDYEVTAKFFTNLNKLLPFPRPITEIVDILDMEEHKKQVSNFVKRVPADFGLWNIEEYTVYGKTGKPLKTPGLRLVTATPQKYDDMCLIGALFTNLDKVADSIITSCVKYQSSQETDEAITARVEAYKKTLAAEYATKEAKLDEYKKSLKKEYATKEAKTDEYVKSLEKKYAIQEAGLEYQKNEFKKNICKKLGVLFSGAFIFNTETRKVKKMIEKRDTEALYQYFINN